MPQLTFSPGLTLTGFRTTRPSSIKIWETIRSWHANCALAVAVRVLKTCVLKLPNNSEKTALISSRLDSRVQSPSPGCFSEQQKSIPFELGSFRGRVK